MSLKYSEPCAFTGQLRFTKWICWHGADGCMPVISYSAIGPDSYEVEKFEFFADTMTWEYADRESLTGRTRLADQPFPPTHECNRSFKTQSSIEPMWVWDICEAEYLAARRTHLAMTHQPGSARMRFWLWWSFYIRARTRAEVIRTLREVQRRIGCRLRVWHVHRDHMDSRARTGVFHIDASSYLEVPGVGHACLATIAITETLTERVFVPFRAKPAADTGAFNWSAGGRRAN